jgi:hypothetical protein
MATKTVFFVPPNVSNYATVKLISTKDNECFFPFARRVNTQDTILTDSLFTIAITESLL